MGNSLRLEVKQISMSFQLLQQETEKVPFGKNYAVEDGVYGAFGIILTFNICKFFATLFGFAAEWLVQCF